MAKLTKEKCFCIGIFMLFFVLVCCFSFVAVIVFSSDTTSASTSNKNNIKKYELVSVKIYTQERNIGGTFNRQIVSEERIKYSFIDKKGNIISKDRDYEDSQKNRYRLHKSKNNKSYLVDKSDYSNASLDLYLNEDMYKNIY